MDTNVLISGLLFGGPPGECIEVALLGEVEMVLTEDTLEELARKLSDERFLLKPSEVLHFLTLVRLRMELHAAYGQAPVTNVLHVSPVVRRARGYRSHVEVLLDRIVWWNVVPVHDVNHAIALERLILFDRDPDRHPN